MLEQSEYEVTRQRPRSPAIARQLWRDLAFLHYDLEPEEVQATLPNGLTVDTFKDGTGRERAWVGLVPFWLRHTRLLGLPVDRLFGNMPETNLRTYVHCSGKAPGVYFYTLEAASKLFCLGGRLGFGIPYRHARMSISRTGTRRKYGSERIEAPLPGQCSVEVHVGEPIGQAEPGTLEFFLVERYLLYAQRSAGLMCARVHHAPYPLRRCEIARCQESLGAGLALPSAPYAHCLFSDGVNVDIFPIRRVGR